MGMSIDEAIYCMQSYLPSEEYTHCTECKYYGCNTNGTCKSNEAHQEAVDTMRKYKKIEEIHKKWFCDYTSAEAYTKISEVLEDGKDNC